MPLFMDMHTIEGGVSASDVAEAHQRDLETQGRYGVDYRHYWVDEEAGKIFCLVEAENAESGQHRPPRSPRPDGRRYLPGNRRLSNPLSPWLCQGEGAPAAQQRDDVRLILAGASASS
jgi:hypothetical protein